LKLDWLEATAVVFGIVSVYLSVKENIWSWPTAIVNVTLYILVFYRSKLYADMGLQVIYIAISVYGWYEWLHGGENRSALAVTRAKPRLLALLAVIAAAGSLAIGTALRRLTDASLPYVDASTTTVSLVAQWMMARKILENWIVWVAVDVVYIGMLTYKSLHLTAFLYAVFLALAAKGYFEWKKSLASRPA
jgi:nicotinamide mononucleotide transporter